MDIFHGLFLEVSREMDTFDIFSIIFTKGHNFLNYLFVCLYTNPPWKLKLRKEFVPLEQILSC